MPQPVAMNCRRLRPSFLAFSSASSRIRRSTRFCVSLCVGGRYSPLETIWVGIGCCSRSFFSSCYKAHFSFAKPTAHLSSSLILMVVDVRSLDPAVAIDNAGGRRARPITLGACVVGAQPAAGRCCAVPSGSVARALTPENEASSAAPRSGGVTYKRGRERVSDNRARGEDRNRDVMMRACPSGRIEQVVEPPRRIELRAVSAGCAYRPVAQVQARCRPCPVDADRRDRRARAARRRDGQGRVFRCSPYCQRFDRSRSRAGCP